MLNLEIWIRWGQDKYGCFTLKESTTGKIRYEHSFQFHKSRKKTYNFVISLEYQEEICWVWYGYNRGLDWKSYRRGCRRGRRFVKSSWLFSGRPDNSLEHGLIREKYGKHCFYCCRFETSGKKLHSKSSIISLLTRFQ